MNGCTWLFATEVAGDAVRHLSYSLSNNILLKINGNLQIASGIFQIANASFILTRDHTAKEANRLPIYKRYNVVAAGSLLCGVAMTALGAYQVIMATHLPEGRDLQDEWNTCKDPRLNPYCQ